MKEYCILVVLYKANVWEAPTMQSLVQCKTHLTASKLIVWDNSPKPDVKRQKAWLAESFANTQLICTPENTPLSKVYNEVMQSHADYLWMIFLDQDSHFNQTYFESIAQARREAPQIQLLVPLIKYGNLIKSPGYYTLFKGSYRSQVFYGINATKNMCIVASGMCVSMNFLMGQLKSFNEELSFYGIDTWFAIQFRKYHSCFYVLGCVFEHSLSEHEQESPAVKKWRFNNFKKATLIIAKEKPFHTRVLTHGYMAFRTLKFLLIKH